MHKLRNYASNIANAQTVGTTDSSKPAYTPVDTVQYSGAASEDFSSGVRTQTVLRDPAHSYVYDPDSPFANEEGIISAPNVSLEHEIVGMKVASSQYKAAASVIRTQSEMDDEILDILT